MKVYLLMEDGGHEGDHVLEVFSSKKAANVVEKRLKCLGAINLRIDEWEVLDAASET